jgi:hypothetical protein
MPLYSNTGLTFSPQTNTASPAVKTLRAALMSRSWIVPHSGHVHSRTFKGILATVWPQSEQRLLLGYQRSMPTSSRPYHSDLYSNCRTNSDQLASAIDLAREWFFCMLLTASVSMAITWFSFTNRVESLWMKSLRESARHLVQPRKFWLLLKRGQHGRGFVVSYLFLSLKPRIGALAKHVVVSETSATERLGKIQLLLRHWVEPELVRSLNFHSHIILEPCKDSKQKEEARTGSAHADALSLPGMNAGVSRAER